MTRRGATVEMVAVLRRRGRRSSARRNVERTLTWTLGSLDGMDSVVRFFPFIDSCTECLGRHTRILNEDIQSV